MQNRPIGIFDSGLGGLTVLDSLRKELPNENFVYLGDTARLPYGTKSPENIIKFANQNAEYLIQKFNIKLLVIACHTASAHALESLEKNLDIPVIGVIRPILEQAKKYKSLGLLATKSTVKSKIYSTYFPNIKSQACPLFVGLVEENILEGQITEDICDLYLDNKNKKNNLSQSCDAIILGCTHFPALKPVLKKKYPNILAWIEAGPACAKLAKQILENNNLDNQDFNNKSNNQTKYIFTDEPSSFLNQPIDSNDIEIMRDLS